jgi:DNA polymerase III gamma/tau subunit
LKKINPAIQSRCVIFRFNPVPKNKLYSYILKICEIENISITKGALELVINRSNGDLRKLLNILQSLYMHNDMNLKLENNNDDAFNFNNNLANPLLINEKMVSKILSCPTKKHIIDILKTLQSKNLSFSYNFIQQLINENGISLSELINNIFDFLMDFLINDNTQFIKYSQSQATEIIKNLAIINENLSCCNNENIQLVSFVSIFYM